MIRSRSDHSSYMLVFMFASCGMSSCGWQEYQESRLFIGGNLSTMISSAEIAEKGGYKTFITKLGVLSR